MSRPGVMIADDNSEWRAAIARILESNYTVLGFAEHGRDVIARALALDPDVVTLDISMPEMSGLELSPGLRKALPCA